MFTSNSNDAQALESVKSIIFEKSSENKSQFELKILFESGKYEYFRIDKLEQSVVLDVNMIPHEINWISNPQNKKSISLHFSPSQQSLILHKYTKAYEVEQIKDELEKQEIAHKISLNKIKELKAKLTSMENQE